jgi:hypothetical protein
MTHEDEIIQALTRGKLRIAKAFEMGTLIATLKRLGIRLEPKALAEDLERRRTDPAVPPEGGAAENFEAWLLRRVSRAVQAGEIPTVVLTELESELEAARRRLRDPGRAAAIRMIAILARTAERGAAEIMAAIEAQPAPMREQLLWLLAEAWLQRQRRRGQTGPPRSARSAR